MSTPGTSGSHATDAFESAGNHRVTHARLAAAATAAPPSDSAQVGTGTEDVIEINDDVPASSKRGQRGPRLKSEVWKEFTRIEINGVWKARCDWCNKHLGGET